jgi:hypothetical protein
MSSLTGWEFHWNHLLPWIGSHQTPLFTRLSEGREMEREMERERGGNKDREQGWGTRMGNKDGEQGWGTRMGNKDGVCEKGKGEKRRKVDS